MYIFVFLFVKHSCFQVLNAVHSSAVLKAPFLFSKHNFMVCRGTVVEDVLRWSLARLSPHLPRTYCVKCQLTGSPLLLGMNNADNYF